MGRFNGQVAVVTGGGSGIGRATALRLAQEGARLHVVDLRQESADAAVRDIEARGGRATAHAFDVADADAVIALSEAVYAADGRCDILHNNAGFAVVGRVEDLELADWRRVIEVNVMGVIHGVHAFVPRMLDQGGEAHIVNTASMVGLVVWPLFAPYVTSKHAIVGLSEVLDAELAPRGIRAHAICPGVIDTPMVHDSPLRGAGAGDRGNAARFMKRFGANPERVADAVVDAIVKNKVIRPVPRAHVVPGWLLHRVSPAASGALGRTITHRAFTRASRQANAAST
jgi:NAD(P)-dependent dehydrogenase (short-subunit alcohol dehydrogenase family)